MAGGAEPAPFAGKGQQMFLFAVITPDAGKSVFKIAAVEELVHHLGNGGAQKTVVFCGSIPRIGQGMRQSAETGIAPAARPSAFANDMPGWPCPNLLYYINFNVSFKFSFQ